MNRAFIPGLLFFVCLALHAQNPPDLDLHLQLSGDTHAFHMGEPILLEAAFSSTTEHKYQVSLSSADSWSFRYQITPSDGVLPVTSLEEGAGFGGSIFGSVHDIGSVPVVQNLDLTNWYRFRKPGDYTVSMTTTHAFQKESDEGAQQELALTSNTAEFEILPSDAEWEAAQLNSILQTLAQDTDESHRAEAEYRLGLLDTPASVRELLRLYIDSKNPAESSNLYRSLRESTQTDTLIALLQGALSNPESTVPTNAADLLATLETRKQLGLLASFPEEKSQQHVWYERMGERRTLYQQNLTQANALLLASLGRRSGTRGAEATYQAWYSVELQGAREMQSAALDQLRQQVLNSAGELKPLEQLQFVEIVWSRMPQTELVPAIRHLAQSLPEDSPYSPEVFRLWCQGQPEECSEALLVRALEPNSKMSWDMVLLMPEKSHPELDAQLKKRLGEDFIPGQSERLAAVVLRAGSPDLLPSVKAALNAAEGNPYPECDTLAYLLGYLVKVSPKAGAARTSAELQRMQNNSCGSEVLRTLHRARYSDDLLPVAARAVRSSNPDTAGTAALFLAEHAPESCQQIIWRRLESFWAAHSNASVLSAQEKTFEQQLASALVHANNWKLDPADLAHLKDGCLTAQCRSVAKGESYSAL